MPLIYRDISRVYSILFVNDWRFYDQDVLSSAFEKKKKWNKKTTTISYYSVKVSWISGLLYDTKINVCKQIWKFRLGQLQTQLDYHTWTSNLVICDQHVKKIVI